MGPKSGSTKKCGTGRWGEGSTGTKPPVKKNGKRMELPGLPRPVRANHKAGRVKKGPGESSDTKNERVQEKDRGRKKWCLHMPKQEGNAGGTHAGGRRGKKKKKHSPKKTTRHEIEVTVMGGGEVGWVKRQEKQYMGQ